MSCSSLHCAAAVTKQLFKCYLEYNHSLKTFSLRKLCLASVFILCPVWKINCEPWCCIPAGSALKTPTQRRRRISYQTRISQQCVAFPPAHTAPDQCNHIKGSARADRVTACANVGGRCSAWRRAMLQDLWMQQDLRVQTSAWLSLLPALGNRKTVSCNSNT